MSENYYYLVSGLADIGKDDLKLPITTDGFYAEVCELLTPKDLRLVHFLRYKTDNLNLISLIENENKFVSGGNFTKEELELEIKSPDLIPEYMKTFLESYNQKALPWPEMTLSDNLSRLYYDEAISHPNAFMAEWFNFDLTVRNALTGLNLRKLNDLGFSGGALSGDRTILPLNDASEKIIKNNAADFSISGDFPFIDKLIEAKNTGSDLNAAERMVDDLRWSFLDDLTLFTYFQIETLLAFFIKLSIVERWTSLNPEEGKKYFDRLLQDLNSSAVAQKNA